jgi:hypothetical protein
VTLGIDLWNYFFKKDGVTMGLLILLGLIAYVAMAKLIVSTIGRYTQSKAVKYIAIAVFALIPTWDIIPGHLYFGYLCKNQTGLEIYKTVEVNQGFFLTDGQPDQNRLAERYKGGSRFDANFSRLFNIKKVQTYVEEKLSGEILGTAILFHFYGGWLTSSLFPEGAPSSCPEFKVYDDLWKEVIKAKRNA